MIESVITVKPFRFWCQKVLPLVYDDSLSYYELLCKVVDYINGLLTDDTNVIAQVNELTTFVNDYFTNLDVQEEINNKLDAMVENGQLDEVISHYVDPYIAAQNANIEAFKTTVNSHLAGQDSDITVLEARMDTFASLPTGSLSTDADAELVDIRVGADGTTYSSAGNAVRGQVSDLKTNFNEYSLYDFATDGTFILATINAQTGAANASTNRILLDSFIDIEDIKSLSTNAQYSLNLFGYSDANEASYIGSTSWRQAGSVYDKETIKTLLPTSKYIRIVFKEKYENTLTLADVVTSEFSLIVSLNAKIAKNTNDIDSINETIGKFYNIPYHIGSLNQVARLGWLPYAMNMPPEQSIYSYQLAYNKGCRMMLCDLRKTSDGTFVCWHDDDLGGALGNNVVKHADGTNLTPEEKAQTIASTSIQTLDTYDFGIYKGAQYAGLKILRFSDFVKFCGKLNCYLVVETKYQMTETDIQNVSRMIKQNNLSERVIIAEDVTYYSYTHSYWKSNLPKMIIAIRGGSRAYSSAILQAKQCVDHGFESVISFTSTSDITDEMITDIIDYGISMWFSEITSDSAMSTFESDGWLNTFKYISSSYVQISRYVESF